MAGFTSSPAEPWFGVLFGESGGGKSTACLYAFPQAFFVGPRGGVTKIGQSVVGYVPRTDDGAIYDAEQLLRVTPQIAAMGVQAMVVDDWSVLLDRTYRRFLMGNTSKNAYLPYTLIADIAFQQRDLCRQLNIHTAMNMHPMSAFVDDEGQRWLGRPKLPGKHAPKYFPQVCDSVLRTEVPRVQGTPLAPLGAFPVALDGAEAWDFEWPGRFRNDPSDPDWYTKDRFDCPDRAPMNLGELLRSGGYTLPRAPGLEWMEELVEYASAALLAGGSPRQVYLALIAEVQKRLVGKISAPAWPFIQRWAEQDVKARVWFQRKRAERFARFRGVA